MTKPIEVEIYGQRFAIKGDADEAYVKRLAANVDQEIRSLAKGMQTTTLARLAVLACLNLAHQVYQLEARRQQDTQDVESRAASLLQSIDEQLHSNAVR